jgi:hypothetical protein
MRNGAATVAAEHARNCGRRLRVSTLYLSFSKLKPRRTSIPRRGLDAVLFHRPGNGHILLRLQDIRAEGAPARLPAVRAVAHNLRRACQSQYEHIN